tara:strand:+ start:646 stop:861 length:216 start_codon:yes stop_codon:yes gene_type:complete
MRKQGNPMVDLPQPELDREPHCDHNRYDIEGVYEYINHEEICFEIVCRDCGTKGLVYATIDLDRGDEEWIE